MDNMDNMDNIEDSMDFDSCASHQPFFTLRDSITIDPAKPKINV